MILTIIAGGKGTRLGLTEVPKPMASIGGKPLLEHQILLAKKYGITEVYILSGHLSSHIIDYFGDGSAWGLTIHHVVEDLPLGTAGAVKMLEGTIKDRFMLLYGDVVLDVDLARMIETDSKSNCFGTLLVHPNDHPYDSDLVEIEESGLISKFHPKPHALDNFHRNLVNAGLYILSPDIFRRIPSQISCDFGKTIFPELVASGLPLKAYVSPEYIKDMGTPDRFEKVKRDFASGKVSRLNWGNPRPAIFLDRDGVINVEKEIIARVEDFELLPGVTAAINKINASEFLTIVITNQPVLAKGFCSKHDVIAIHKKMDTLLGRGRAFVDGLYLCPHHPERGFAGEVEELKIDCECRKPKPGMILAAAKDFNIDLSRSWFIGDRESDIIAGRRAGIKTILVHSGFVGKDRKPFKEEPDYEFDTLELATNLILEKS